MRSRLVAELVSHWMFLFRKQTARRSVAWLPCLAKKALNISIKFLSRKRALTGWLFFAPLLNRDACYPRKQGFEHSSSFLMKFVRTSPYLICMAK